jgi:hypothetical protein
MPLRLAPLRQAIVNSLALKTDGSIFAWGINGYGRANSPAGNDYVAIAAGQSHGLALMPPPPDPLIGGTQVNGLDRWYLSVLFGF